MITKTTILLLLGNVSKRSAPTAGLIGGLTLPSAIVVSAVSAETSTPPSILDSSSIRLEKGSLYESELTPDSDPNAPEDQQDTEEDSQGDTEEEEDAGDDGEDDDDDDAEEDEEVEPESELNETLSSVVSGLGQRLSTLSTKYENVKSKAASDPARGFGPAIKVFDRAMKFVDSITGKGEDSSSDDDSEYQKMVNSTETSNYFSLFWDVADALLPTKDTKLDP